MLRFIWTVTLLGVVFVAYIVWIRPQLQRLPHLQIAYIYANGFWQRLAVKLRTWWDFLVMAALVVLPEVPNLLDSVSGMDLDGYFPSGTWKLITQVLGIAGILIRALVLRSTSPVLPPAPPVDPVILKPPM